MSRTVRNLKSFDSVRNSWSCPLPESWARDGKIKTPLSYYSRPDGYKSHIEVWGADCSYCENPHFKKYAKREVRRAFRRSETRLIREEMANADHLPTIKTRSDELRDITLHRNAIGAGFAALYNIAWEEHWRIRRVTDCELMFLAMVSSFMSEEEKSAFKLGYEAWLANHKEIA